MINSSMKFEKKKIFLFIAALALSFFCAFLCIRQERQPAPIDLSLRVKPPRDGFVKIFYTENGAVCWQEEKSFASPKLPGGKFSDVKFQIPVQKLKTFRMDFEYQVKGEWIIRNLTLSGLPRSSLADLSVKHTFDIKGVNISPQQLTVQTEPRDPYLVLELSQELMGEKRFDPFLAGIVLVFSFMIFYCTGSFALKLLDEKKEWADLLLVTVFCVLICIPVMKIDKSTVSARENRTLALRPRPLTPAGWINTDFGRQFESYFNDRFLGREPLLGFYQRLISPINKLGKKYAVGDAVVEGKDKWFFYRLEGSLRNFQNLDVLTEEQMEEGLGILKKKNEWCKKHNIKFYYYIAPDKNKVYGENMTFVPKVFPDSRSRTRLWVDYIRKNSDIKVIYPLEELKQRKKEGVIYYKGDTHWNSFGAYFGYLELMKEVKKDFPDIKHFETKEFTEEKGRWGDLYLLMPHVVGRDEFAYKRPVIPKRFDFPVNERKTFYFNNHEGKYKLCIMRDSFCDALLAYLFYTFNDVAAHWRYSLTSLDLQTLLDKGTNVIILEHVERLLPNLVEEMKTKSAFRFDKEM